MSENTIIMVIIAAGIAFIALNTCVSSSLISAKSEMISEEYA